MSNARMNLKFTGPIVPAAFGVIAGVLPFAEAYELGAVFAFAAILLMALREVIDEIQINLLTALDLHRDIERMQKLLSDLQATLTNSESSHGE